MKLFENGVGRPSNEIKKKRRLFIASVIAAILLSVGTLGLILLGGNSNKLKGAAYLESDIKFNFSSEIYVEDYSVVRQDLKNITIKLTDWGSKVKQVKLVACKTLDACKSDSAWKDAKMLAYGVINNKNTKEVLELDTDSSEFKTYYIRISTYSKKNDEKSLLRTVVTEVKASKEVDNPFFQTTKYAYKWGSVKYTKNNVSIQKSTISMPKYSKNLQLGKTYGKFSVTTNPVSSSISVTSSNPSVLQVLKYANNSWGLKAKKVGTATITAKSSNGTVTSYKYTVKQTTTTVKTNKQNSYKITFGMHSSCKDVMTLNNKAVTYNGSSYKIPNVNATYKNKNYTFQYWIIQRTNDGRYRAYNKDTGKYVWYSSSKDSKINWSYATFKPGESISAYNAPLRLYAVCGSKSSSGTNGGVASGAGVSGATSNTVPSNKIRITYLKNNSAATGSMQSKDFDSSEKIAIDSNSFKLAGYTFNGWKAYRIIDGTKKYFVNRKGWSGTSSNALFIRNGEAINSNYNISKYTGGGNIIYLEAQWRKK